MNTVFLDIDTQVDFMRPQGRLYVPKAVLLNANLRRLTALADALDIPVVSTLDYHRRNDPEFRSFPPHCVRNTAGSMKIPQTVARRTRQTVVRKQTIDVFSNPRLAGLLAKFERCFIYGVALDYCVKTAAIGCRRLGLETWVVSDATAAIAQKAGAETKKLLQLKGVKFIRTAAVKGRIYGRTAGSHR